VRGKNLLWISLLTVLMVTASVGIATAPTCKVSLDPSSLGNIEAGTQVTVDIKIDNVVGLSAWEARLEWNPFVMAPVGVAEGPFLKSVGPTLFTYRLSPFGDGVLTGAALMTSATASGDGVLATVTLKSVGAGSTTIDIAEVDLRDVNVNPIDCNVFHSSVNVHIGVEAESVSPEKSVWSISEDGDINTLYAEAVNHAGVDHYAYVEFSGFTMDGMLIRYLTSTELVPAHGKITLQTDGFNATELGVGVYRLTARAFWSGFYGAKQKSLKIQVRE
jgi:hypothetical protein